MAQEQVFQCSAHPITGSYREQKVFFAYPEEVNRETGMMLLISGFGGTPEANVYKKMRKLFAEQYNLIVVQSTYLGMEFMGDSNEISLNHSQLDELNKALPDNIRNKVFKEEGKIDLAPLMDPGLPFRITISGNAKLNETEDNFAEMGPIQAIDCVRALQVVYEIVKDTGHEINLDRVIAYGHSHGAYLSHLCNRFFPELFSYILDNSAWISPVYLTTSRVLTQNVNNLRLNKIFTYRIASEEFDKQLYDLQYLYNGFKNKANIVIYQGVTDNLIDHKLKQSIFRTVDNVVFNMITADKVDGVAIKSTNHGDADFVELFHKEVKKNQRLLSIKERGNPFNTTEFIRTKQNTYQFDFFNDSPRMMTGLVT